MANQRRDKMTYQANNIVQLRLRVSHYATWYRTFQGNSTVRQMYGCVGGVIFRKADDPNELFIQFVWKDLEQAHEYFRSQVFQDMLRQSPSSLEITYLEYEHNFI
jgi:quinol monooxygenase YgiN